MATHEGWTNYPTWAVALWIDNDEPLYRETRRRAKDIHRTAHACDGGAHVLCDHSLSNFCENCKVLMTSGGEPLQTAEQNERLALADGLKAVLTDHAPDLGASVWSDLLSHAMEEVNWREIAEHILGEL